ncbi:hypothetical protein GUJ93_ZPchr0001g29833 [Zizania palustris]|uniref:Uncharacterized protein n=1 Tax=Zizania palustris TaxID=103762 RepID=A0A8J5SAJ6_ZIZPA|nr:hypothetical protein GUJ93_ZPchr0001g29833 [Zizania palustris]
MRGIGDLLILENKEGRYLVRGIGGGKWNSGSDIRWSNDISNSSLFTRAGGNMFQYVGLDVDHNDNFPSNYVSRVISYDISIERHIERCDVKGSRRQWLK